MIDSVVRIEQATGEPANILVTHNPDGTTSIEASAADPMIVKDEKSVNKIETAQFAIPAEIKDIKGIDLKVGDSFVDQNVKTCISNERTCRNRSISFSWSNCGLFLQVFSCLWLSGKTIMHEICV